jgi:hypothetical protein
MIPVQQAFNAFVLYRQKVGKSKPTLSNAAQSKINKAIAQVGLNDLLLLFKYFTESDDEYVAFMNGKGESARFYGTLDNLLRITKLDEKVQRARSWQHRIEKAKKNAAKDMFVPFQLVEQDEYQQHLAKEFEDEQAEPQQQIGGQQALFAHHIASRKGDKDQ